MSDVDLLYLAAAGGRQKKQPGTWSQWREYQEKQARTGRTLDQGENIAMFVKVTFLYFFSSVWKRVDC